jgi:hypothetical protein
MYILSAGPLRAFFNAEARTPVRLTAVVLLCWLLCWQISSAFFCAPYYLSRFNNLSGGTRGGYLRSVDSDFDWGQDLKRLSCWTRDNAAALGTGHIALDYFGGSDAGYYLGGRAVPWRSAMGDPRARGISWLAVSAENLSLAIGVKSAGSLRDDRDSYTWLKAPLRPDHKAGTSIFIYDLRRR